MQTDLKTLATETVRKAGGGAVLARALGLTRQAIYQWSCVPPQHVLKIEQITGVPRHEQRPDLYPAPDVAA